MAQEPIARREMLAALSRWSGAALALAGIGGITTGCGGKGGAPAAPAVPEGAPPRAADIHSSVHNSNYFDYANYANYINGPQSNYGDYANYGNYSDYSDNNVPYSETYSESYLDYSNYSNYADYSDYNEYSDYSNSYADNYSDYGDYADTYVDGFDRHKPIPKGRYGDYADVYADSGAEPCAGRIGVVRRPPFQGVGHHLLKGQPEAVHGPDWVEPPGQRMTSLPALDATEAPAVTGAVAGTRFARQGGPNEITRPERQKQGRYARRIAGPANRTQGGQGDPEPGQ